MDTSRYTTVVAEHESWLAQWPDHLAAWQGRHAHDPEGAIAEAWVRRELSKQVEVEPYEIPGQGGVDYRCRTQESEVFAVEVANLDADAVGKRTGLPEKVEEWEGGSPGCIASKLMRVRLSKSAQLAKIAEPVLLALTCLQETVTFTHFCGSGARDLLVPPTERGITSSRERPIFNHAFFFKPGTELRPYTDACPEVAGVLLCAVPWVEADGQQPVTTLVLNPLPRHPFDRAWLPNVRRSALSSNWSTTDPCNWGVSISPGSPEGVAGRIDVRWEAE
jgi:hypothetical protein